MATRFYLSNTPQAINSWINVPQDVGWEDYDPGTLAQVFSNINNIRMDTFRRGTTFGTLTNTRRSSGIVLNDDNLIFRAVSAPLTAQSISGTLKGQIRVLESSATLDARSQVAVRVAGPDGTIRGTLLAMDTAALSNEWPIVLTNRKFPLAWTGSGATLSSVNALAGDAIIIEVGARTHVAIANGSISARVGDSATSDLPEDETTTTELNPWFEFSQDLVFQVDGNGLLLEHTRTTVPRGKFFQMGPVLSQKKGVSNYGVFKDLAKSQTDRDHPSDVLRHSDKGMDQLGPYQLQRPFKSSYANRKMPTTFAPYVTERRPSFLIKDGEVPPDLGGGLTRYYYMSWRDVDAAGPSPTFRTWTVTGAPDPTGTQYVGAKSGATPITNAFVAAEWFE